MSYFVLAAICAVIGVVPLLLARKFVSATIFGIVGFLALWAVFYYGMVTFMAPYLGPIVFWTVVFWSLSTCWSIFLSSQDDGYAGPGRWALFCVPALYLVFVLGTHFFGSDIFRAADYAQLIGPVEQKVWTRDSQPKDVRHVRLIGDDTALYIAQKWVGNMGAVGSQFHLASNYMTLQRVHGDLKYVIPLDFAGFSQWTANGSSGVPYYMIIDAQDSTLAPQIVTLPEGKRLVYTPGASFSHKLWRHLLQHGVVGVSQAGVNFELDPDGQPWWVVSTAARTIGWGGWKLHDVILVDPSSGAFTRYAPDKVPEWVDRVMPGWLVQNYLANFGKYSQGWGNSFWSKQGITKPEMSTLIYGVGDRLQWVTGITSDTSHDDSLVGIAYTDSHTGKTTIYKVDGGTTDTSIVNAVNASSYVQLNKLHAGNPQIYNLFGRMTAVVPLMLATDAYAGTALVDVRDPQITGVGSDTEAASSDYQAKLYQSNQQALPGNVLKSLSVKGVVDRIRQDVAAGTTSPYYLHLAGVHRLFTISGQNPANVKIVVTQPGDTVVIEYDPTGDSKVPVKHFDNLSLPLDQSPVQGEVAAAAASKHVEADVHSDASDVRKHLSEMKDADLVRAFKPQ